ncbi:hypothetical protein A6P08_15635 [Acidithiobacillus thiooxidans]|nr:hypothetical protein A6P08_15635 [Acidithiobacillus thiooxidans]
MLPRIFRSLPLGRAQPLRRVQPIGIEIWSKRRVDHGRPRLHGRVVGAREDHVMRHHHREQIAGGNGNRGCDIDVLFQQLGFGFVTSRNKSGAMSRVI